MIMEFLTAPGVN